MPLIEVKAGTPTLAAGTYPATLVGINVKSIPSKFTTPPGQMVDALEWTWLVEGPESDVEITSVSGMDATPKSTLFKNLVALVGVDKAQIGAGFEESDLVGKPVLINVSVKEDGYSKIDGIMAAPKASARTRSSAPVERVVAPAAPAEDESDLPF